MTPTFPKPSVSPFWVLTVAPDGAAQTRIHRAGLLVFSRRGTACVPAMAVIGDPKLGFVGMGVTPLC